MKYFAIYDESGKMTAFGTSSAEIVNGEITESEYNDLMQTLQKKVDYAEKVNAGEISIDDVPEEYREEVAAMVEEMQEAESEVIMSDVDEALAILHGEVTE